MSEAPVNHRPDRLLRLRTVLGGVVLSGVLLLTLTVLGGVGVGPAELSEPGEREQPGPLTAIQPELHHALLGDEDLAPAGGRPTVAGSRTGPRPRATGPAPVGPTEADPGGGTGGGLCRTLFEDPAELPRFWDTAPRETTSQLTGSPDGGLLQQVLSLFDSEQARAAYARLREVAAGCDRFRAALADGTVVTVLLEELSGDRQESAHADQTYALRLRTEDGARPLVGWLALDRVGPVVSVLRHLEEAGTGSGDRQITEDLASLRAAALLKLGRLLGNLYRTGTAPAGEDRPAAG